MAISKSQRMISFVLLGHDQQATQRHLPVNALISTLSFSLIVEFHWLRTKDFTPPELHSSAVSVERSSSIVSISLLIDLERIFSNVLRRDTLKSAYAIGAGTELVEVRSKEQSIVQPTQKKENILSCKQPVVPTILRQSRTPIGSNQFIESMSTVVDNTLSVANNPFKFDRTR